MRNSDAARARWLHSFGYRLTDGRFRLARSARHASDLLTSSQEELTFKVESTFPRTENDCLRKRAPEISILSERAALTKLVTNAAARRRVARSNKANHTSQVMRKGLKTALTRFLTVKLASLRFDEDACNAFELFKYQGSTKLLFTYLWSA